MANRLPCPLPRCALEWCMASLMAVLGLMIGQLSDEGAVIQALEVDHLSTASVRLAWTAAIILVAAMQSGSLLIGWKAAQRWAAFAGGVVMLVLVFFLATGKVLTAITGIAVLIVLWEMYIFTMLGGSRARNGDRRWYSLASGRSC